MHYGKAYKKAKGKSRPGGSSGGGGSSKVNAGNTGKPFGKGRKVALHTDICWRCGKSRPALYYFNEHGDLVYANTHMVHVKETNWNKHLF